jgi:hypothetical protein
LKGQAFLVAGVTRTQYFSNHVSTAGDPGNSGSGNIATGLNFAVTPSTWYAVSIGAWVECDHNNGIGESLGQALVQGNVGAINIYFLL